MKEELKYALYIIASGVLAIVGMRAAEWAIPKPETRVLICFQNDMHGKTICRSLKDIIDAQPKTPSE